MRCTKCITYRSFSELVTAMGERHLTCPVQFECDMCHGIGWIQCCEGEVIQEPEEVAHTMNLP